MTPKLFNAEYRESLPIYKKRFCNFQIADLPSASTFVVFQFYLEFSKWIQSTYYVCESIFISLVQTIS